MKGTSKRDQEGLGAARAWLGGSGGCLFGLQPHCAVAWFGACVLMCRDGRNDDGQEQLCLAFDFGSPSPPPKAREFNSAIAQEQYRERKQAHQKP